MSEGCEVVAWYSLGLPRWALTNGLVPVGVEGGEGIIDMKVIFLAKDKKRT